MTKAIIGLDLSTQCTGYSYFIDNKLIKYGQIKPKTTLSTNEKIEYIIREFVKIFKNEDLTNCEFIIEDIFLGNFFGKSQIFGFANLGRISGAIMASICLELNKSAKDIKLIMAISARPLVGLKGNCQKAEVQSFIWKKVLGNDNEDYEAMIDAVYAQFIIGEIDKKEFKKQMEHLSKLIEEDTQLSEDQADAILLGYGQVLTKQ